MPKVYITSRSAHDYSDAKNYGEIVFLSEGPMNRFNVNHIERMFYDKLRSSGPDDYLLLTGLGVMNSIACWIFGCLHKRLNLLLYKQGVYIERNMKFREEG